MIGNEVLRWLLSALFAGLGAWHLAAALRELFSPGRRSPGLRRPLGPVAGPGLHVAMCAAMIAMSWSWGAKIPAIAQVTVFTAGGGWFAGRALFGAGSGGGESWYHAGMMAAMVWMAVAMSALTTPVTVTAAAGPTGTGPAGTADSMGSMPGMAGMAAAAAGPGRAAALGAPAWWVSDGSLLLCAAFFAAALFFAASLFGAAAPGQRRDRGTLASAGAGVLTAAGMAVTFLELAGT